jgi:hypothetical protein
MFLYQLALIFRSTYIRTDNEVVRTENVPMSINRVHKSPLNFLSVVRIISLRFFFYRTGSVVIETLVCFRGLFSFFISLFSFLLVVCKDKGGRKKNKKRKRS